MSETVHQFTCPRSEAAGHVNTAFQSLNAAHVALVTLASRTSGDAATDILDVANAIAEDVTLLMVLSGRLDGLPNEYQFAREPTAPAEYHEENNG